MPCANNKAKNGVLAQAMRADNEDIRVIKADKTHVPIAARAIKGFNPNKTPSAVATPFPPLNFSQTG